jgi:hypothetical protein
LQTYAVYHNYLLTSILNDVAIESCVADRRKPGSQAGSLDLHTQQIAMAIGGSPRLSYKVSISLLEA